MGPGIILIGMMGSGKSTVGRALAALLEVPFEDTDQMLEYRLGRQIPQLFELYGEAAFRHHETSVLKSLEPMPRILATGGGIILEERNWEEFRRLGQTVFLDVPDELLIERLEFSSRKRPLLQSEDWKEKLRTMYATRRPIYQQADFRFAVSDQPIPDVAQQIVEALIESAQ